MRRSKIYRYSIISSVATSGEGLALPSYQSIAAAFTLLCPLIVSVHRLRLAMLLL